MSRMCQSTVNLMCLAGLCVVSLGAQPPAKDILVSGKLTAGLDMGVNSSGGKADWLKPENDSLRLSYPSDQSWGAVFITVGKPKQPPRPFRDLSAFKTLTIEMRGGSGGEQLEIGIKTNAQPDDGSEAKVPVKLTSEWKTYRFPLDRFEGIDLDHLYVVTEFVFAGSEAKTIFVRNIKYLAEK